MARAFYIDIEHRGLNKYQRVKGPDALVVQRRAAALTAQWDRQWARQEEQRSRQTARDHARSKREADRAYRDERVGEAENLTREAQETLAALDSLLTSTLAVDDRVEFESLRDRRSFDERPPAAPAYQSYPAEPAFQPKAFVATPITIWQRIVEMFSTAAKQARLAATEAAAIQHGEADAATHAEAVETWRQRCAAIAITNTDLENRWRQTVESFEAHREEHARHQRDTNLHVDEFERLYRAREPGAVQQYCMMVLTNSNYPDSFPRTFDVRYVSDTRMVIVEYTLPAPADLPTVQSMKYVAARDEMVEVPVPEKAQSKLFDSVTYQITIRTLHELFEADAADGIESIAFNGCVDIIDSATGRPARPCIVSIHAKKAEFAGLNLSAVDPKACFRKLKGVGSAQLANLAPVPPLVVLPRDDARYVDGREVLSAVDHGSNLAAMDWEEFEHLVRQLFELEFGAKGAEVRVTRASRDGGVDAVAMDPDPIRGGKFVIQAKRYTHVVPVSAVRELFGTTHAEGAMKGILVTTSNFGSDSYEFAKDKPLQLIDGSGLLSMLERHGRKAYINLAEARQMLGADAVGR